MRTPINLIRTVALSAALLMTAGLTLSTLPAEAQRSGGGGGSHGGGGGGGGSHGGGGGSHGGGHHGGGHRGGGYYGGYYGGWYGPYGWGWGGYWGPYWGGGYVYSSTSVDMSRYAAVDTDISPEAAEVYLDGKYIGTGDDFDGFPDFLYLKPGKYTIEFRHPAYETMTVNITARRGQKLDFNQDMKPLPGKGKLSYFDPENRGTPLGRVFGPSGTLEPEQAWRDQPSGTLEDESRTAVEVKPEQGPPPPSARRPRADLSYIIWKIKPQDAAVYLDDRYVGVGEDLNSFIMRGMATEPGSHTIVISRPGYQPKTLTIEAKAGEKVEVTATLEKVAPKP